MNPSEDIYRSTIRTVCVVFSSLFNNIYVRKYNPDGSIANDKQRVEIAFSGKQQYALWIEQKMRLPDGNTEIGLRLPRLSFELTGLNWDEQRQLSPWMYHTGHGIATGNEPKSMGSYSPAAYKFNFNLSLWAKNMDTSIQVLDQILPYFKPDLNVKVKEQYNIPILNDVNVLMTGISKNDNYLDGFDENRLIEWDLSFDLSANIWTNKPDTSSLIKEIIVDFDDPHTIALLKGVNYYDT